MSCKINVAFLLLAIVAVQSVCSTKLVLDQDWKDRFLKRLNDMRAKYCAPPMVWNETYADYATTWAENRSSVAQQENQAHPHGNFVGATQNAMSSGGEITPEECALIGHYEISLFYNKQGVEVGFWHYVAQARWDLNVVGAGMAESGEGQFCIVNFGPAKPLPHVPLLDTVVDKYNVYKTTCRLTKVSCLVDPDQREDFNWDMDEGPWPNKHGNEIPKWEEADCARMGCCYDGSVKPNFYYPVEGDTEAKRCPPPKLWSSSVVIFSDYSGPTYKPGTTATLKCRYDKPQLAQTSTCQTDGTWSPAPSAICQNTCDGPKGKRIPAPLAWRGGYLTGNNLFYCANHSAANPPYNAGPDKYCYDKESDFCYYPFSSSGPRCGQLEDTANPKRQQFQRIQDVISKPGAVAPYPIGTVVSVFCPNKDFKGKATCNADGNWVMQSNNLICPYTCDVQVKKRRPYSDGDGIKRSCNEMPNSFFCWDPKMSPHCYLPEKVPPPARIADVEEFGEPSFNG